MRDLVTRLQHTDSMKCAVSLMAEIGVRMNHPTVAVIEDLSRTVLLNDEDGRRITEPFDWPSDFIEHWLRENYTVHFPGAHARLRTLPYVWNFPRAARDEKLSAKQRRVMRELADVGAMQAINVPVHLPRARVAIVSWLSHKEGVETERALDLSCELMAAAHFFMNLVLRSEKAHEPAEQLPTLSPRELESLAWAARGKSDQDIAAICTLSPATVRCYIDSAASKLGATTRTQAVAVASELGLLHGAVRH